MINAIAIDDEQPALEVLEAFCERTELVDLRCTFTQTSAAHRYLEKESVELIFIDINMPAQSGIEFVRQMTQTALIIFTTAHSEHAVESYTLNAVDYLLKPFFFERFLQAVHKAHDQHTRQSAEDSEGYLLLRVDYSLVKVYLADILFIEGLDNYLKIYVLGQKAVVVRLTIKAMLDKLPTRGFVRVHRSYIVALSKIQSVRNKLILIETEEIPLSSTYESNFFSVFQR